MFANSKVSGAYFVAGNGGSSSTQLSRSSVPLGPFTGYASVLKGSRFLKPAHQLLEELCDVGRGIFADKVAGDSSLLEPPLESLSGNGVDDDSSLNCSDGSEHTRKKSRLLSTLDEVFKRYKQYYQQMQAVFASFESVAGLSSAAPFASLAISCISYPTDTDKLMLAKQTGLSRNQRRYTPSKLIKAKKASQRDDHLPASCSIECEKTCSSVQRNGDLSLKRTRNDLTEAPTGVEGPMNLPFNKLSHNPLLGVGMSNGGGSGGVSLTLGLHQNGMGLSDSYPITAARRFGLDSHGEEYVVGGFTAHNRQIGGQLVHDFQESDH
ncbi:hypothetical protein F511_37812 [Dorcoceras hygrometricum]|uniref:POX domain-containing protein n=1 Tax=Dorcoceras hygrometricum TaxID=472368 RepID=A0A2Z7ART5_9LAMI|nr:hypothetical protein F511_37812 [Dorcoceras hygrometricum]